jgi:predicted nucleic acid-binding protein
MRAALDTDVIIRLLTGDDPEKQARAEQLLESAERGDVELWLAATTVADAVFVLTSRRLYAVARGEAAELMLSFVTSPGVSCDQRDVVLTALELFSRFNIDFGDAFIAASALRDDSPVYSFDRDYDKIPGLRRIEP